MCVAQPSLSPQGPSDPSLPQARSPSPNAQHCCLLPLASPFWSCAGFMRVQAIWGVLFAEYFYSNEGWLMWGQCAWGCSISHQLFVLSQGWCIACKIWELPNMLVNSGFHWRQWQKSIDFSESRVLPTGWEGVWEEEANTYPWLKIVEGK